MITIYGASDDLIEIEGDICEEFNVLDLDQPFLIGVSNGLLLRVELTAEGEWWFHVVWAGHGAYQHTSIDQQIDGAYSELISTWAPNMGSELVDWVMVGSEFRKRKP